MAMPREDRLTAPGRHRDDGARWPTLLLAIVLHAAAIGAAGWVRVHPAPTRDDPAIEVMVVAPEPEPTLSEAQNQSVNPPDEAPSGGATDIQYESPSTSGSETQAQVAMARPTPPSMDSPPAVPSSPSSPVIEPVPEPLPPPPPHPRRPTAAGPIVPAPTAPLSRTPVRPTLAATAAAAATRVQSTRPIDGAASTANAADVESTLQARVRDAVQAAVRYPAAARMMQLTGRTRMLLDYRDGSVAGPSVVQSSGIQMLDQAALTAAQTARYPLPPPSLYGRALRMLVWVDFRSS